MTIIERILAQVSLDGPVVDVRMGPLWTAVVVETPDGLRAGLASTQLAHDLEHGHAPVRDAGRLIGKRASELAALALTESLSERSLGFATLNALLQVDGSTLSERNAEQIIVERAGRTGSVAIVGHFPFVPRVRGAVSRCWVLELNPQPGDLPASAASQVLPQADVIAITGMALVNGTFEALAALCRPQATVLVLGATTPLSPVLFEYGVNVVAGTLLTDIPAVLAAVGQGANFHQIPGKRLVTLERAA